MNKWPLRRLQVHLVIPRTLAENAGLDPVNTIIEVRKAHAEGKSSYGVNVFEGGVMDMSLANVLEPVRVVEQAIQSATENGCHDSQNRRRHF